MLAILPDVQRKAVIECIVNAMKMHTDNQDVQHEGIWVLLTLCSLHGKA